MIIISGFRSGSSWMMQILMKLGYPIKGLKFHKDFPHKELNPNGYWDLPVDETKNGLKTHYKGYAVKLPGASLYSTNANFIKGVVVCKRNREDQIQSIIKSLQLERSKYSMKPTYKNAELLKELNDFFINMFFKQNDKPKLEIEFESINNCENKLRRFLCQ